MKKTRFVCLILAVFLGMQSLAVAASGVENAVDASIAYGCNTIDGAVPLLTGTEPIDSAESIILFEANTQTLMYAQNADVRMYPASLVKIMTALIAIEQGTMTDVVTVKKAVLDTVPANAVSSELVADEVIGLQDLLYCMMVDSANDAAAVLADHIGGTQESFVAEMNRYAAELGCTNTQFLDPHGLDGAQYTTARDAARILSAAMENEQFAALFGTVYYDVPATNKSVQRNLSSGNYLMDAESIYYDSRVTGGRTGMMDSGARCIASVAERDKMRLVTVVLGAKSIYQDDGYTVRIIGGYRETSKLLDMGFEGFQPVQIFSENQAFLQRSVDGGDADVVIGPQTAASAILPVGIKQSDLVYRYTDVPGGLQLPVDKGALQSVVEVWHGNVCVAQADLYALNGVQAKAAIPNSIANINRSSGGFRTVMIIIGVAFAAAIILFLTIRVIGRIRFAASRSHSRQYRRNRRRSR